MSTTTQSSEKPAPPVVLSVDLRDYFAAKAMQGAISSLRDGDDFGLQHGPKWAYQVADAMLKERAK